MQEKYFLEAYKQSLKANIINEVPVGAILVKNNKIIAKGYNTKIKDQNPIAHAEINCIKKASKKLKTWRLNDCELYVTMEPCKMCREIIAEARITKVYYLLKSLETKKGYKRTGYLLVENKKVCIKYKKILNDFFLKLR